jgi:hypothetical protein
MRTLWPSREFVMAATGFLVNGNCHATSADAAIALQAPFPVVSGNQILSSAGVSFTAPNTFALSLEAAVVDSNMATVGIKTMTIAMCDPSLPVNGGTVFDPIVGAAFFSMAMTWVFGLFLIGKNAGAILNSIKRF